MTTLVFLLDRFCREGMLPSTRRELYQQGCRQLCGEETSARRRVRERAGISDEDVLSLGKRIAAVTALTGCEAVWTGIDRGNVPSGHVTASELAGGSEPVDAGGIRVTEASVRRALNCALFAPLGTNRMRWAHRSYAEFLAAAYLLDNHVPPSKALPLITAPADPEGRIVPHLSEIAAWLANGSADYFAAILDRYPAVLLRSDVASAEPESRAKLVGKLLDLFDRQELLDQDSSFRRRYAKLAHPGIAEQLRPYITDKAKSAIARRSAAEIAEACRVTGLLDDLTAVALRATDNYSVRVMCAYAVQRIGSPEATAMLRGYPNRPDCLNVMSAQAKWSIAR